MSLPACEDCGAPSHGRLCSSCLGRYPIPGRPHDDGPTLTAATIALDEYRHGPQVGPVSKGREIRYQGIPAQGGAMTMRGPGNLFPSYTPRMACLRLDGIADDVAFRMTAANASAQARGTKAREGQRRDGGHVVTWNARKLRRERMGVFQANGFAPVCVCHRARVGPSGWCAACERGEAVRHDQ